MTGGDGTPADSTTPGQPDPFGEYADDWKGNISATELSEEEEARRRELHDAAVRYQGWGFRCIPLHWMVATGRCSCGDESCQSPGKHPVFGRWQKPPETPADEDSRWWRTLADGEINPADWSPRANIGIVTGEVSGIFVVDVDCKKNDGFATLQQAENQHPDEPIPDTLMVKTGSGGRHYFFRNPDFSVGNPKPWGENAGIDIKGDGGMVVAVPSLSGYGPYTFAASITSASQIPPAPSWVLEKIAEQHRRRTEHIRSHPAGDPRQIPAEGMTKRVHAYVTAAIGGAAEKVRTTKEGQRNIVLNDETFDLCSKFVPAGLLSIDDVIAAMQSAGEACGLRSQAVFATIRSAWNAGQRIDRSAELPDFLFEAPDGRQPAPDKPEPLTDTATPWLPRDAGAAVTGLDPDGRVQLDGDVKKDNSPYDVIRLAWGVALGHASPHVAVKGGDLVVVSGAEGGALDISELTPHRLRLLCASAGLTYYHHVKETEGADGTVDVEEWDEPALPSLQLCNTVLTEPAIKMYRPVLAGISRVPVLRPDRTLLERQGVDQSTSRVYWPDLPIGPIPVRPSRSEVAAARKFILDELLHDFPWACDADKANCLGLLLTSYVQPYKEFLSPLHILNAPKAGSGKGNLVTVMAETTGAHFRSWVNGEEEIRKSLTTVLRENDPVVIFDDVGADDIVKSATLASALTRHQWDDRLLGGNQNFRGVNNRVWCLTGNHVRLGGDIPSRSVLIHLNPGPTDPKARLVSSFKLGDFDPWIRREENRVRVIRALLTLITDWAAHGAVESAVHHRFAGWAAVTGGVLEHHKVEGFLANQAEIDDRVERDESLADFLACWYSIFKSNPQQVSKVRESLSTVPELGNEKLWKGTWPKNKKSQLVSARGLADMLRRVQSQDMGGYQVDVAKDVHSHDVFYVTPIDTSIDITESNQNLTT